MEKSKIWIKENNLGVKLSTIYSKINCLLDKNNWNYIVTKSLLMKKWAYISQFAGFVKIVIKNKSDK